MNEIHRPTRWETKKKRMARRISQRDKVAILKNFERATERGEYRDDILHRLSTKYDRSERQIERYIQQARTMVEGKQAEQITEVIVIDDKPRALMVHFEAMREAINIWIEKQHSLSDQELSDLWKGKLDAWGVIAEVMNGQGSGRPAMSNHALYEPLRSHLVPPVVSQDFWPKVSGMVGHAIGFLSGAVNIHGDLTKAALERSGFGITANTWQDEPVTGLTEGYVQTLYDYATGINSFRGWAHSFWAITWPATGGMIITWPNEGVRLLSGRGYDPFIRETYWILAGDPWLVPRHMGERVAYGNATLNSLCSVAFLLCFGTKVIAVVPFVEQLALCQEVHKTMMADCITWQRTTSLRQARVGLDSLSQEIIIALEHARSQTSFPGKCSLCP